MTDDNSENLVDIPESLEDFRAVFLQSETPSEDEGEDTEDNALATDEDKDADAATTDEAEADEESEDEDEDTEDSEDSDEEDDEEEEPEPKPEDKPKRKSNYQTRINELTRARHEAERREQMLLQRLEALEGKAREPKESSQEPSLKEQLPPGAPTPSDLNDKGEPKYALGEFDPQYIFDLTQFSIEAKTAEIEKRKEQQVAAQQLAAEQEALRAQWAEKVAKAEEENPEIIEHISDLVEVFQNIPPQYGEYLATTIMQCENGPMIMDYLSQNIGEAQDIVASGPAAATLAIGRLEARLSKPARHDAEEKRNKKISGAKTPPAPINRGSSKGKSKVSPDTDDLAAFKRDFGF